MENSTDIMSNEDRLRVTPANDLLPALIALSQKLKTESKDEALLLLRAALCISPDCVEAHENIGYLYADLCLWENAKHHLEKSLCCRNGSAQVFFSLGNVCMSSGDCVAAAAYYEQALALQRFPEGLLNLSVAYTKLGNEESRLNALLALTQEFGNFPQGFNNLGVFWYRTRKIELAIECFKKAIELEPGLGMARYGLSHALLMNKDYLGGFKYQESRWGTIPNCPIRNLGLTLWLGEEVPHSSKIVVTLEQGFGDTLQMLRFLPMLKSKFSEISIEVQPAMARLVKKTFPDVNVLVHGDPLPNADFYCPIMSLPWAFRISYDTIPVNANGYLHTDDTFPSLLPKKTPGTKKIGLCWRGGVINPEMLHRSLSLNDVTSLFDLAGCEWVSLVKDLPADEQILINRIENLTDYSSVMTDFFETYRLIQELDLVVSIDTAVAHLAAAMGKKTIIILNDGVDWRWHLDDDVSAWYPNAPLLRSYNFPTQQEFMATLLNEIKKCINIPL